MKKDVVIIFGYNNTRIYDIERLKNLVAKRFAAEIVLCKDEISEKDQEITPYTLAVSLNFSSVDEIKNNAAIVDDYILNNNLKVIACLSFSDRGVPLGSYYANFNNLVADDFKKSFTGIDKYEFRKNEAQTSLPTWYQKPLFSKITDFSEAEKLVKNSNKILFFKPIAEGNSRGCIQIDSLETLYKNRYLLEPYFKQGIIVEECITDCHEYSFDGVAGQYVIVEKKTSAGEYRVETQHIVPAPLSKEDYDRLLMAGKYVNKIVGSKNGAVHNELFLNLNSKVVYCVEPNRRPGGLKMWDWIKEAFTDLDNWQNWLSWATNNKTEESKLERKYFVGCRMLQSKYDGIIENINSAKIKEFADLPSTVEINITKKVGHKVTKKLTENGDFIGYFVCKHENIDELRKLLDNSEKLLSGVIAVKKMEN